MGSEAASDKKHSATSRWQAVSSFYIPELQFTAILLLSASECSCADSLRRWRQYKYMVPQCAPMKMVSKR